MGKINRHFDDVNSGDYEIFKSLGLKETNYRVPATSILSSIYMYRDLMFYFEDGKCYISGDIPGEVIENIIMNKEIQGYEFFDFNENRILDFASYHQIIVKSVESLIVFISELDNYYAVKNGMKEVNVSDRIAEVLEKDFGDYLQKTSVGLSTESLIEKYLERYGKRDALSDILRKREEKIAEKGELGVKLLDLLAKFDCTINPFVGADVLEVVSNTNLKKEDFWCTKGRFWEKIGMSKEVADLQVMMECYIGNDSFVFSNGFIKNITPESRVAIRHCADRFGSLSGVVEYIELSEEKRKDYSWEATKSTRYIVAGITTEVDRNNVVTCQGENETVKEMDVTDLAMLVGSFEDAIGAVSEIMKKKNVGYSKGKVSKAD